KLSQGNLTVGPGEVESAIDHPRMLIFSDECKRILTRSGYTNNKIDCGGLIRRKRNCAPKGDDGIEHRPGGIRQRPFGHHRGGGAVRPRNLKRSVSQETPSLD